MAIVFTGPLLNGISYATSKDIEEIREYLKDNRFIQDGTKPFYQDVMGRINYITKEGEYWWCIAKDEVANRDNLILDIAVLNHQIREQLNQIADIPSKKVTGEQVTCLDAVKEKLLEIKQAFEYLNRNKDAA